LAFTIVPVLQVHPKKYRKVHIRDPKSPEPCPGQVFTQTTRVLEQLSASRERGGAARDQRTRSTEQLPGSSADPQVSAATSLPARVCTWWRGDRSHPRDEGHLVQGHRHGEHVQSRGAAGASLRPGRNRSTSKHEELLLFSNCCLWLCSFFLPVLLQGRESIFYKKKISWFCPKTLGGSTGSPCGTVEAAGELQTGTATAQPARPAGARPARLLPAAAHPDNTSTHQHLPRRGPRAGPDPGGTGQHLPQRKK